MTDSAVVTFATFKFERDDFFVLALFDNLAVDSCAVDRRAVRGLVAIGMHEHLAEHDFLADITFQQIDIDSVALRDAILPPASFDDCESHKKIPGKSRALFHKDAGFASAVLSLPAAQITDQHAREFALQFFVGKRFVSCVASRQNLFLQGQRD